MQNQKQKNILLGVTGSISAYKSATLVRLLRKQGYDVKVVMSEQAKDFITPLTLSVLSKQEVLQDFSTPTHQWNSHIEWAHWADVFLIYPASCHTIAKMANGLCDNLLLAIYLSARCPILIAPAMDSDMWMHASTRTNMQTLMNRNCTILDVEKGELASGLVGYGRVLEPEKVVQIIQHFFIQNTASNFYAKKKVLVTLGSTREPWDSVRFIGNSSSGKMGKAIADELLNKGAEVTLIHGFVDVEIESSKYHKVVFAPTAEDMFKSCQKWIADKDMLVMVAAVADYKPATMVKGKMNKQESPMPLQLIPTIDVLKTLAKEKKPHQYFVGFALEDGSYAEEKAMKKLHEKNVDCLVLNNLQDKGVCLGSDENKVSLFFKNKNRKDIPLMDKPLVAKNILDIIQKENEK